MENSNAFVKEFSQILSKKEKSKKLEIGSKVLLKGLSRNQATESIYELLIISFSTEF